MGRPKNCKQLARLTVVLDAENYARICNLANENDVSAAWIIRRAIGSYLDQPQSRDVPAAVVKRGKGRS